MTPILVCIAATIHPTEHYYGVLDQCAGYVYTPASWFLYCFRWFRRVQRIWYLSHMHDIKGRKVTERT